MFRLPKVLIKALFIFCLPLLTFGQEGKIVHIDLGKIKKNNEDVVDLVVKNPLDVPIKLLSYETEPPLTFQIMSSYIPAGGYQFFRLKTNLYSLGEFERSVELHFDQAELNVKVHIRGEMSKLPSNGLQKCPSFDDLPSKKQMIQRQKKINGEIQSRLILLGDEAENSEDGSTTLLNNDFKANNIIFLIDVSSSMGRKGKIELLKGSMHVLLNSLREQDQLSIVIYDDQAQLILDNEKVKEKDSIRSLIDQLKTKGSTNAIEGIDLAINKGMSSYLQNGNNQLYLVSDGAFELRNGENGTIDQIDNAANGGLKISVLAIRSNRTSRKSLKKLSKKGKGELIRIDDDNDQDRVLKNIMKNSKL